MLITFVVFCVCVITILTVLLIYLYKGSKNPTTVPSLEPRDSKLGNFPDIQDAGGFELFLDRIHADLGPVVGFWYGETYVVSVGKASLLKPLNHLFHRATVFFEMVRPVIGSHAVQFANSSQGKTRWRAYSEAMSGNNVVNKLPDLVSIAKELADSLKRMPKDDHALLQNFMLALAMKMLSRTQMGCYFEDDDKIAEFYRQYDSMNEAMNKILNGEKDAEVQMKQDIAAMQSTIRKALAAFKADKASGDYQDAPLLSAIIDNTFDDEDEKSGEGNIGQELGDVITLVIGGYHTTGYGLTWVLYYLTVFPEIQDKVRGEMTRVLGDDNLDSSTLSKLVYTRQVVDETLRITRLSGFAARTSVKEETIGGHVIPPGIPMLVAIHVICHDEEVFQDPQKFDPERFSPEAAKAIQTSSSFPIFGFGARRCPGYNWAYAEIMAALSVLVRKFRVLPTDPDGKPDLTVKQSHGFVTKPDRDVWVRFQPIESS